MIVDLSQRWREDAACTNKRPEMFFTDHGPDAITKPSAKVKAQWDRAKRVCRDCPVMLQCARDNLGETEGVWGGLSPADRVPLRAQRSVSVRNLVGQRKVEYAKLAYDLRNERRLPWSDVARIMGVGHTTAQYLNTWYTEHLKTKAEAEEKAAEEAREAVGATVTELPKPFPRKGPQSGDCWVRHNRRITSGHYLGQTEDGAWYCIKAKLFARENSTCWFKAEDVKLTKDVVRNTMVRVGKDSRIYGTTLSTGARRRQKAG